MSKLVKLKIKTMPSGMKKNRVTTISAGARKAYGANRPCNREKVRFFAFEEMGKGSSPSPVCSFLFTG